MDVHATAGLAKHRLRHEGGVHAVLLRDFLDNQAVGHDGIRHLERLVVAKVNLVLRRADLVVAVLDLNAEVLEVANGLLAQVDCEVAGGHIEVTRTVQHLSGLVVLEVVVLKLRTDVEGVPQLGGLAKYALEHVAWVTLVRGPVRLDDVAEHGCDETVILAPGHNLQGSWIWHRDHVGLFDASKAQNRGAVEAHALFHGHVELIDRNYERLQESEYVREPQVDKLNVLIPNCGYCLFAEVLGHAHPFRSEAIGLP